MHRNIQWTRIKVCRLKHLSNTSAALVHNLWAFLVLRQRCALSQLYGVNNIGERFRKNGDCLWENSNHVDHKRGNVETPKRRPEYRRGVDKRCSVYDVPSWREGVRRLTSLERWSGDSANDRFIHDGSKSVSYNLCRYIGSQWRDVRRMWELVERSAETTRSSVFWALWRCWIFLFGTVKREKPRFLRGDVSAATPTEVEHSNVRFIHSERWMAGCLVVPVIMKIVLKLGILYIVRNITIMRYMTNRQVISHTFLNMLSLSFSLSLECFSAEDRVSSLRTVFQALLVWIIIRSYVKVLSIVQSSKEISTNMERSSRRTDSLLPLESLEEVD